jgi:hypothetical protein
MNTAKGHSEPHGRRRDPKGSRPGRDNSPSRGPGTCAEGKAATNDPRGRRLHDHSTKAPETRGAKNRKGEFAKTVMPTWVSAARDARTNAAAGWSGGRMPPRRNGAASECRRDANRETSREVADRPVRRERGGRQTDRPGRRWWSRKPTGEPSQRAIGLLTSVSMTPTRKGTARNGELKRARTLRRAPQRKTDADGRTGREGKASPARQPNERRGQSNTPRTNVRPTVFRPRRTAGAPRVGGRQRSSRSPTSAETL